MKPGSTLRFRVEDPTLGIESSTWSVIGSKRTGDLYFSRRNFMSDLKLSLHESGITRMAWTAAAADSRVEPGADRVMSRWTSVQSLPDGWAYVLRLSIPDCALSPILPPLPGRPSKPTVTLPPAGPGRTMEVRVLWASRNVEASALRATSKRSAVWSWVTVPRYLLQPRATPRPRPQKFSSPRFAARLWLRERHKDRCPGPSHGVLTMSSRSPSCWTRATRDR